MGRRKGRKESSETLNPKSTENDETPIAEEEEEEEAGEGGASGKFFACYLLTSLSPRFKGHTYIGFTVNPRRRIRQHNGEIGSGAWRTKKRRPWEMVFCIYGFPTNVAALQFEWAWQHPVESLAVRKAAATFTSLSGLANKIKLAYTMLTLPSWQSLNLTVNYFSTKYMKHAAHCPRLPEHMRVQVGSLDELPCYTGSSLYVGEDDEWDTEVYCEQSMGSQESTDDASADTQKVSNFAVVQDSFKEIEHGRNQLAEESAHEQGGLMERTVLRLPKDNSTDVQDSFKEIECGRYNWAVEKSADELEGSTESTLLRQPKHLRITEEEAMEKQSSGLNDCQVITPPFSISSCNTITRNAEDRGTFRLLYEFNDKYGLLLTKQSPEKVVANKDQPPSISSEVEVIDVFTPSPCYKVNAGNKKRKLSVACPDIIDLTNSPMFV